MTALLWLGLFMLAVLAALGALAAGLACLLGGEPWTAAITTCAVVLVLSFSGEAGAA